MLSLYNRDAPKKPTNLTVNTELLNLAKSLDLNISSVLETALVATVKQKKGELWLKENADAIDSYNEHIQEHGLFGDEFRAF